MFHCVEWLPFGTIRLPGGTISFIIGMIKKMQLPEYMVAQLTELRHRLHRIPEPSGGERQTARLIRQHLEALKPQKLITAIGGHGIVALFDSGRVGPAVLFRAELDGLPIHDNNPIPYRSQHEGYGHKCGHDGHMAILVGLGQWLFYHPPKHGRVILLFQPAEENGAGARAVLDDERFKSLQPDYVFALHNWPGITAGILAIKSGPMFCASGGLTINLEGKTAHAALPETGINPAPALADIIASISKLPRASTFSGKFISTNIVNIKMGREVFGTSPGTARLGITLRSADDAVMDILAGQVLHIISGATERFGLDWSKQWSDVFAAAHNEKEACAIIRAAATDLNIPIHELKEPLRPSEDFGWFSQKYRGAIFALGAGETYTPLHSEDYDFPDTLIPRGVSLFARIAERLCGKKK